MEAFSAWSPSEWEQLFPEVDVDAVTDAALAPFLENEKPNALVQSLGSTVPMKDEILEADNFASWMDEKVDLSSLISIGEKLDPLYDLNAMAGDEDSLMQIFADIPHQDLLQVNLGEPEKLVDFSHLAYVDNNDNIGYVLSAPQPESPECIVPDIASPVSSVASPVGSTVDGYIEEPFEVTVNDSLLLSLPNESFVVENGLPTVTVDISCSKFLSLASEFVKVDPPDKKAGASVSGRAPRCSKPYSRPLASNSRSKGRYSSSDKFERKKTQNKEAATRYRDKKRAEGSAIQQEEAILENENKDLKKRVDSLTNEISYLKNLMKEILQAKGLIR